MALFGAILYALVGLYALAVVIRIIVEMIQAFSKRFDPPHWFILIVEPLFRATDLPVNALIPPLRLGGGVGLDVSVIVLFLLLAVLQTIIGATMISPAVR